MENSGRQIRSEMEIFMKHKKFTGFSGFQLKLVAVISMFVDHIGAVLLEKGLLPQISDAVLAGNSTSFLPADYQFWYNMDILLRCIGRLSFPLFCFLLVEGFQHTGNVKKYALRLGIFALLSEIPFDLAVYGCSFSLKGQNVFFTLFLGLLTLCAVDYFNQTLSAPLQPLKYLPALTGMLLAHFFQTDYAALGILLIVVLYAFKNNRTWQCLLGAALTLFSSYTAFLAFFLIYFYNGKRGRQPFKYFFYAFYPLHLLLFYALRLLFYGQ